MTKADRKIATVILADFPFSGLGPIGDLAEKAKVSAPSITRFVAKLGYLGYQDFQRQLVEELKESTRSPVDFQPEFREDKSEGFLSDYFNRLGRCFSTFADDADKAAFAALCDLLSNSARSVFVIGGRVSQGLAHHLTVSLQLIRSGVEMIAADPEQWPEYLQRLKKRDLLIIFDFRRYQKGLERFAESAAAEVSPQIVLLTDQWLSPISRYATHTFTMPTDVGTVWDSYATTLALIEAVIVVVSERDWEATRKRMGVWDRLRPDPKPNATVIRTEGRGEIK